MPQLIRNLPFPDYLALDLASKSGLSLILRSPAHYRYARSNPSEPSSAQALGTLAHATILEPESVPKNFAITPQVDRRTKAGKEEWAEYEKSSEGLIRVTEEQWELAQGMREAVLADPQAAILLGVGEPELTVIWEDENTGLGIKNRFDWWNPDHRIIIDLKTTRNASEQKVSRDCGEYGYHLQNALYLEGARRNGLDPQGFLFIFVESSPPHGVALYELDEANVHAGMVKCWRALEILAECKRTNTWPNYPPGIHTIEIPPWLV